MVGVEVPWLGEDPIMGTVPADDSLPVTLLFTATTEVGVNQPGDYFATLNVRGDPSLQVPVTMTVLPAADMGQLHGFVLDNCTTTPVEALVSIAGGDPITETMSDKDTGYYSAWLYSGQYDVTFNADGYLDYTINVQIPVGGEVVLDVDLVPDRACIEVEPSSLEAWLLYGSTDVYTHPTGLDIYNNGGQSLNYEIFEKLGLPGMRTVTVPAQAATLPAGTAAAAGSEFYKPLPEQTISIPTNVAPNAGPNVLLVCAEGGDPCSPLLAQLQAFGDLSAVDAFDGSSGTPTLAQLQAYDVVVTWTDYTYADPNGMGNVLADYVDVGGKVIPMMFSMGTHGWQMGGRFMSENYTAINGGSFVFATSCLGTFDAGHPIMAGVTDVCEYYRLAGTYLTAGSSEIARWQDNELFVGAKDDRTVVSINSYPGINRQWTGQMDVVIHNAILWLVIPPYQDVPWIWEEPVSGTIGSLDMTNIAVMFTALYTDTTPMPLGDYTATLTIENNDPVADRPEISVTMHIVEEYIVPTASFTADSPVCFGEAVVIDNTSIPGIPPMTDYEWDFGDGTTSNEDEPGSHAYDAPGLYTITLTACNMAGCDTSSLQVEVLPLPVAGFEYAVEDLTVVFTNTSTDALSYLWDFGDGITDTLDNPTHTYATGGTFVVTLWAFSDCGASMAEAVVTVVVSLNEADLSVTKEGPATVVVGETFTYTLTVVNMGPVRSSQYGAGRYPPRWRDLRLSHCAMHGSGRCGDLRAG